MNAWIFLIRSLRFHGRSHLGTILGACIASAVLTGALIVGDSVRGSLLQMAMFRLGQVDTAIVGNDRLFEQSLAQRMQSPMHGKVVPVIQLPAVTTTQGGDYRANQSWLLGVTEGFWDLATEPAKEVHPAPGKVVLGSALAAQLQAQVGTRLILRVQKPSMLSPEAPLSPEEGHTVALRLEVSRVISDAQFGRFSLQASQLPAMNAFVDLATLQQSLALGEKANLLLLDRSDQSTDPVERLEAITQRLRDQWTIQDSQLKWYVQEREDRSVAEIRSERVFLDAHTSAALLRAEGEGKGVLTYFVNDMRSGDRHTPYSMVSAVGDGLLPVALGKDEAVINQWLAEDLELEPGDRLKIDYFQVGLGRTLEEASAELIVKAVVPMAMPYEDPSLMPDFPGLKDAENCRDWDTGFPIDLDAIRDQDNAYWESYQGTPKAFVSLATGQALWQNRFGDLTSVRWSTSDPNQEMGQLTEYIEQQIEKEIDPLQLGISILPVSQQALASVIQSQDFGGLFIGFSFFLILAALILMNLLFQFVIEKRASETGLLLATGMTLKRVNALILREGALLAMIGSFLGLGLAVLYAQGMLLGLTTLWKGAIGTSSLSLFVRPPTLLSGGLGSVVVASLTLLFGLRRRGAQGIHLLLSGASEEGATAANPSGKARRSLVIAGVLVGAALIMVLGSYSGSAGASAAVFFGAGALMLLAGWFLLSGWLLRLEHDRIRQFSSLIGWALRNSARRRRRSLATITMLACGAFLVMAVGANKLDATRDASLRSSGTGGFAFWAESAAPIVVDLNQEAGLESFGLYADELEGVSFVPFRVKEGEEASCLNLNRAQRPRIMGVDPVDLIDRQAFSPATTWQQLAEGESVWHLLSQTLEDGAIPGLADNNSILWAMGKQVGDVIEMTDASGREQRIRLVAGLANSILQGSVIIAEEQFVNHFKGESGYRAFLIDAPVEGRKAIGQQLSRATEDVGLTLFDTVARMEAFNAVQNTYLSTFQMLGGLGLVLGSFGLGAVVLRNLQDRQKEWAILAAIGFSSKRLRWLVCLEHVALLMLGLMLGCGSALFACWPSLGVADGSIPWFSLSLILMGMILTGLFWTWAAARQLMVKQLVDALHGS